MLQNFKFYTLLTFLYLLIGCKITEEPKSVPVVQTNSSNEITLNSAKVFGAVVEEGSSATNERGIVYSPQNPLPSTSDSKIISGFGKGEYSVDLNNLLPNTKYFFRAYAVNSIGIGYGSVRDFATLKTKIPTVATGQLSEVTYNSAKCSVNLVDDGGEKNTEIGIVYSTSPNPTILNTKLIVTGNQFVLDLQNLTENTKYYIRAFATNSNGTAYGIETSFTTTKNFNRILKEGLAVYYPFNGNALDASGNNNNGSVFGASLTTDRFNATSKAYNFNGSTNYISLKNTFFTNPSKVSALTYSFWINPSSYPIASKSYTISGKEGFWRTIGINLLDNGKIQFAGSQPSPQGYLQVNSSKSIELLKWTNVTITFKNGVISLYINGEKNTPQIIIDPSIYTSLEYELLALGNSTATNFLGATYPVSPGITNYFNGKIDDFGVWNRVLTEEEIQYLFSNNFQP